MSENLPGSGDSESIRQLQRALFYESQFRNAIVSDAVSFFDANITRDSIESDFFFRDNENDFVSVPDYLGLKQPCKFSEFMTAWFDLMVPDSQQKVLNDIGIIRETLLETYRQGKREYILNYWAENTKGVRTYFNHRFLLTVNEDGDICALSIIKDSTRLHEIDAESIQEELQQYAYFDPITKGYNYNKFKEEIKEQNLPGSLISLDIHSFKIINSICGVSKGDDVIRYIWDCISNVIEVEKGEFAAHINADHYVVFLPTIKETEIVNKIKSITLSLLIISGDLDVPEIHPYYGISRWAPGKKIELSYSEAITAKHNAKYMENTNYAFFNEEDTLRLIREKYVVDNFEKALAKKEFKVWFQPKFSPKNRELVGAEALVRWIKEDGSIAYPDEFIPVLERNNLIRTLDEYIFRNVCTLQAKWQNEKKKTIPISINLSRASLYFKGIAEQYERIVQIAGIKPELVPIEITESAAVSNDRVKTVIEEFHECGFSIHMDDFGSGYSSLASLNLMHFDTIKLDKSLIDFIGEFGGNRLIEHTISLAKEMGIQITAEGVENETQVKFLKQIGCDSIQGYFYSKPVPVKDFEKILNRTKFELTEAKADLIEEHMYDFNQSYYQAPMNSIIVNISKNWISEYTEIDGLLDLLEVKDRDYSKAIEAIINCFLCRECNEAFIRFLDRDKIINDYAGFETTQFGEFKISIDSKISRIRIIKNIFKVEDSQDIWGYFKLYFLS